MRPYENNKQEVSRFYENDSRILKNKLHLTDYSELEIEETKGFLEAQTILIKRLNRSTKFDTKYILQIHKLALNHLYAFAGKYRDVNLAKADHDFLDYGLVINGMNYLNDEFLSKLPDSYTSKDETIKDIAIVHCELIHIHPFREGNGRTARILANMMSLKAGYKLLNFEIFSKENYSEYISALNQGDKKEYGEMIKIIGNLF